MLSTSDKELLKKKGISVSQINEQLDRFKKGFPYLKILYAAELGKGITKIAPEKQKEILSVWTNFLQTDASIVKFVPASGAASRMFKALFEFLDGENNEPTKTDEKKFFFEVDHFAFFDILSQSCYKNTEKDISGLLKEGDYKTIAENLLLPKGLNYGALPKGLLKFHNYVNIKRTPMQEHMVEGALYASNKANSVKIHFTVSSEHKELFKAHLEESIPYFKKKFNVEYNISFSEQKPSTDTIAVDANNEPFRENGELVFRPGGHGALIENLNDLDADVIFIKNIDNVVPDNLKEETVLYKKLIGGLLVKTQQQCFEYLRQLEDENICPYVLDEISSFCEKELCIVPHTKGLKGEKLRQNLIGKLNRPIRICGMVKNEGEPGGGPFIAVNQDGTASPQILESSQINTSNPADKEIMQNATHFNPVDLVCGIKNYKGKKFNLLKHVDKNTGFISEKSKNGKELKALELPGLWNGAMSDWNTIFVEVPIETFNPVKTVNDLLRPEHQ